MKKILIFAGIFILSGLLFTGFSPSVDGRAVVAEKGELPSGLFGKTVGYLPGDSVSVVNPANGKTVDILVLGSLDSSQGVAILISPEAAAELGIEKNANNLVKLTKRTGKLDEQVYGRATIAKDERSEMPLFEETPENAESLVTAMENAEVEQPLELYAEPENIEASSPLAMSVEIEPVAAAEPEFVENEPAEIVESEALSESFETDGEPVVTESAEEIAAEPVESELPAVIAFAEENEEDAGEGEPADEPVEIPAEDPVEDAEMEIAENAAGNASELESVEAVESEYAAAPAESEIESEPVEETEVPAAVAKENEKIDGNEFADEEYFETAEFGTVVSDEPELEFVEQENIADSESVEDVETYAPIVLVPASENPPAFLEKSDELAFSESESLDTEVSAETDLESEEVIQLEVKPSENKTGLEAFIVPSLSDLQKGKYYVQIAMMNDEERIVSLLDTYRNNYPMVAVPLSNKKGYQIMVGPLERDEYGSVRQKFKERGFKDCFLRKIK